MERPFVRMTISPEERMLTGLDNSEHITLGDKIGHGIPLREAVAALEVPSGQVSTGVRLIKYLHPGAMLTVIVLIVALVAHQHLVE